MPSDEDRIRQVFADIGRLKSTKHPAIVGSDGGYKIVERPWADVPERSKLAMLQDLDWSGVSGRDQAHILLGQLDSGKLLDAQRIRLIETAAREEAGLVEDELPMTPGEFKAFREDVMAEERAVRVIKYGEAETSKLEEEARTRDPDAWMASLSIDEGSRRELASILEGIKRDTYVELEEPVAGWNYTRGEGGYAFHELPVTDREVLIEDYVPWHMYMERGLTYQAQFTVMFEAARDPFPRGNLERPSVSPADLDKLVSELEAGWTSSPTQSTSLDIANPPDFSEMIRSSGLPDSRSDFQRMLDEAGERDKSSQPKERDRGGPER